MGETGDELRVKLWNGSGTIIFDRDNLNKPLTVSQSDVLDGLNFRLKSYNGIPLPASQKYDLSFKDGSLTTKFCNAMDGSYIIKDNSIQAGLRGTDMACSEPANIMEMESRFGLILNDGAKFSLQGNTLTLTGNNPEKTVFVFEKITE